MHESQRVSRGKQSPNVQRRLNDEIGGNIDEDDIVVRFNNMFTYRIFHKKTTHTLLAPKNGTRLFRYGEHFTHRDR